MHRIQNPRFLRHISAIILCASLGVLPTTANASTTTGLLAVSATVLSICIVAATPLAFGNYDGSASSALTSSASIIVTCSFGTGYTVALGAGGGTGATTAARSMTNGSSNLNYLLYTNSGRTTLWGDGNNSTSTVSGTAGLLPATYTVYGSIPAAQFVTSGLYGDTVTITVSY